MKTIKQQRKKLKTLEDGKISHVQWKDLSGSWIARRNIVNIVKLLKAIYRFCVNSFAIPMTFFTTVGEKS
jgi:hypothetical protein